MNRLVKTDLDKRRQIGVTLDPDIIPILEEIKADAQARMHLSISDSQAANVCFRTYRIMKDVEEKLQKKGSLTLVEYEQLSKER